LRETPAGGTVLLGSDKLRLEGGAALATSQVIALTNFLNDAAKYGREGGQATLSAKVESGELVIEVWNEGERFSNEDNDGLFKKFSGPGTGTPEARKAAASVSASPIRLFLFTVAAPAQNPSPAGGRTSAFGYLSIQADTGELANASASYE
jgi:hypothetical protein